MPVKYITVTPITNLFVPATRSFGDIAIVGAVDPAAQGPKKTPVPITNPLAVSSQAVTLTTNAATAAANATLHFAAVPSTIRPGMVIVDLSTPTTAPAVIPSSPAVTAVTLITSGATAAANPNLNFAAVPGTIQQGMGIVDLTTPAAIPTGTAVVSTTPATATTPATVVMNQNATGAGVGSGDAIEFVTGTAVVSTTPATATTPATVVMSQNATGAGVGSGDAIQFVNPNNGKPVDDIGWFKGALADSVNRAFAQSPSPTTVWAIATDPLDAIANRVANGLAEAAKINVQIVVLANTPLLSAAVGTADIEALAKHCNTVSNTGADGMERIGIAMLGSGVTNTTGLITATMAQNRMTMIAHNSREDAAAAVAGVIAGYPPHISVLLKPITIDMDKVFSDSEIDALNTARVNWVTRTPLIPGAGFYMGEGYTLGADQPYIDIVRTIDEISFALKAALIRSIGVLRVTRAGLRGLASEMIAVLQPLEDNAVIDSFVVFFPLLTLLDKSPAALNDVELQEVHNAQATRTVASIVTIEYAGAIHRLNITLKFE
jgi:hypothetical protein